MLEPNLGAVDATGLGHDIGTLALDRSYHYPKVRAHLAARLIDHRNRWTPN